MISPLEKISVISPKCFKKDILNLLQNFGQAEISNINNKNRKKIEEKIENISLKLRDIEFALSFLKNYKSEEKKSLWQKLAGVKPELTVPEIQKKYKNLNLKQIIRKTQKAEEKINLFESELTTLKQKKQEIAPWQSLDALPSAPKYFKIIFGKALLNNYLALTQDLEKKIKNIAFELVFKDLKYVYLTIILDKDREISQILNQYKFERQEFAVKNPKEAFVNFKLGIRNFKNALKQNRLELRKLSQEMPNLEIAYDYLSFKKQSLEARKNIFTSRYFNIISIWVQKNTVSKLRKKIRKISPEIILKKEKITKKDKPPVIIANKSFVAPFEIVTGIYGLPKFGELDPTPFLAPFFILFFALCLTDAGYGLIMAIVSVLAIIIMKIPKQNQKFFRLLIYAGIMTFFIGAVFGGWFGIDLNSLPESSVKDFLLKIRLINPMTDTLLFMGLTFVLGFIQVWFSQIVKLYHGIKIKNKAQMLESSAWAVFLLSLPASALLKTFWPAIICFLFLIMLTNLNIKIFLRPFIGVISVLQGLIGFMSDILSYSRLMALGLATGIIGFIINIIAGIFRDMIPVLGWGIWVLALIGGHLFNIGINALGGFIHSARLQFVEFFPKFLEGGGKKFEPFEYKTKFIKITPSRS
ncbi:MAG: V-type ATPase 116kDa subunit family protein [bacterium]